MNDFENRWSTTRSLDKKEATGLRAVQEIVSSKLATSKFHYA